MRESEMHRLQIRRQLMPYSLKSVSDRDIVLPHHIHRLAIQKGAQVPRHGID